jgi:myo-inositol-1(or 4)-monophosphatase
VDSAGAASAARTDLQPEISPLPVDANSEMKELKRIREALEAAARAIAPFVSGAVGAELKSGGRGPVTEADRASNRALREVLVRDGEGWLSEESVDGLERLSKDRVWVVDPLDGTLEFVSGIPEWCVSVALIENGRAIAGGICNPTTSELFLGSLETGLTYNDKPARPTDRTCLAGAIVVASRSEVKRGEWEPFKNLAFSMRPMGSVAYKLALLAAGRVDATWTLTPKNEWDVAGGVALIESAGGSVCTLGGSSVRFNNRNTLLPGLIASAPGLQREIVSLLAAHITNSNPHTERLSRRPAEITSV